MNDIALSIYKINNVDFILALLKKYENEKSSIEEIALDISFYGSVVAEELIVYAKDPLKEKIQASLELLRKKNQQIFLEAERKGVIEQVLNNMTSKQKCDLLTDLGIDFRKRYLTKDEQRIFKIISASIDKTLEEEARNCGFNSYEELLNYKSELEEYEIAYTFAKLTLVV